MNESREVAAHLLDRVEDAARLFRNALNAGVVISQRGVTRCRGEQAARGSFEVDAGGGAREEESGLFERQVGGLIHGNVQVRA